MRSIDSRGGIAAHAFLRDRSRPEPSATTRRALTGSDPTSTCAEPPLVPHALHGLGVGLQGRRTVSLATAAIAVGFASLALSGTPAFARGVARLAADLNPGGPDFSEGAKRLGRLGDQVLFAGRDAAHGQELWRSDGSDEGTELVLDIRPGALGSQLGRPVEVGGIAYLAATDGEHGAELWRSDGTSEGTWMVADIRAGELGSFPRQLVGMDGILYFTADGNGGEELWRSDGSGMGTERVADIHPGALASNPHRLAAYEGLLYFTADDGVHGREFWASDGTEVGTAMLGDLRPGQSSSADFSFSGGWSFVGYDGLVYFSADDGVHGVELFRSDGTPQGTELFLDLELGPDPSHALPHVAYEGKLLFSTSPTFEADFELWSTDSAGTTPTLLVDGGHGRFDEFVEQAGTLYFTVGAARLWRSDGTPESTEQVYDIGRPACAPNHSFRSLTPFGGGLVMRGHEPGGEEEIWFSDGTFANTRKVFDINPFFSSEPKHLVALPDAVLFVASDGAHGRELWRTDGSAVGTAMVADLIDTTLPYFTSRVIGLTASGSTVFAASADQRGIGMSDGTEAGSGIVPATENLLGPIWHSSVFPPIVSSDEEAFFWSIPAASAFGLDLWRADGTLGGTQRIGAGFSRLCGGLEQRMLGDTLLFGGCRDGSGVGFELWRSDGTTVSLVRDIATGSAGSSPRSLVVMGGTLLFFAFDSAHGYELWRSDGTEAGTLRVADVRPGTASGVGQAQPDSWELANRPQPMIAADAVAYFVGNDGVHGAELWRTDGTAAGTRMVVDLVPGPIGSLVDQFGTTTLGAWDVTPDGTLYFIRFNPFGFRWELWRSDGTAAGTRFVALAVTTGFSLETFRVFVLGESIYFSGPLDEYRVKLWRTDGTPEGTAALSPTMNPVLAGTDGTGLFAIASNETGDLLVFDELGASEKVGEIAGDGASGGFAQIATAAGRRYFVASEGIHGRELWTLSCGDGVVESDEQCDDGARNGAVGSCCTLGCSIRTTPDGDLDGDSVIDWCDPQEGAVTMERALASRGAKTPRADGRIRIDGQMASSAGGFDPAAGVSVRIADAGALDLVVDFPPESCRSAGGGLTRCRSASPWADLRLDRNDSGYDLRLNLRRLDLPAPLAGPLTLSLTQARVLDWTGTSAACNGGGDRLTCRP